ncbi:MAG TPA: cellulase family glycosylhydrolase [Pyrinomonadaceae bacterium]|nr:cellulase family glycosylhydrolase [Pyrinomonadaceae bacterium]
MAAWLISILFVCILLCAGCTSSAHPSGVWPSDISAPTIPNALGVNIHFTDPKPGELAMVSAAGFRWIRTDFVWQDTEVQKGNYDFAAYDRLINALSEQHLRALFILDYTNRLYDGDHAPHTTEGRRGFANWAAAAVKHFRGRGVIWEIYNEPNTPFWTPAPNVSNYVKLALETSVAMRQAAPEEQVIGPSVWGVDFEFLEACFQAGLLNYWTAVSVHPYRKGDPETVVEDYARLRELIQKYAPANKRIPIISSEWGYSSASFNVGEQKQAALLARQMLINQSQGIALSIWYDWRDDGREAGEIEHHFGTVLPAHYVQRVPPYDAKPSYIATQTLTKFLDGCGFGSRLGTADFSGNDYVFAFRCSGQKTKYAAWTTAWFGSAVLLPMNGHRFRVTSLTGQISGEERTNQAGLRLSLTAAPQFIEPLGQ